MMVVYIYKPRTISSVSATLSVYDLCKGWSGGIHVHVYAWRMLWYCTMMWSPQCLHQVYHYKKLCQKWLAGCIMTLWQEICYFGVKTVTKTWWIEVFFYIFSPNTHSMKGARYVYCNYMEILCYNYCCCHTYTMIKLCIFPMCHINLINLDRSDCNHCIIHMVVIIKTNDIHIVSTPEKKKWWS